jgi:hypothetical protein
MPKKNKYTVILKYPDYATEGCIETTVRHVSATCLKQAVVLARREASAEHCDVENPSDWFLIAVFNGHHFDFSDGEGDVML